MSAFSSEWRKPDPRLELLDINCDGVMSASDPTAFGQQFQGTGGSTKTWHGLSLPPKPQ